MAQSLAQRIVAEYAAAAGQLPAAVVRPARRQAALRALEARGLPTAREENWRYANLRPLERARFAPALPHTATPVDAGALPAPIAGYARYTFVDGVFAPGLSSAAAQHAGIVVRTAGSAEALSESSGELRPTTSQSDERFALLNEAFALDAARVHARAGADCPACLEVLFVATRPPEAGASYPRLELHVERNASLGLIERHMSAGAEASFVNSAVRVTLEPDARVEHYRVQQMGGTATWIDTLDARLAERAAYRVWLVGLGAASARSTLQVCLAGEAAELGLHAASVADRHQVHDTYALVEHAAARTRTAESFRGIAAGRSRVAFNGKIVVREGARGADSQQSLRGLLAGPEAEIDVRPQLEIYTDDVRCSHGATAGKLDETMLFYLLSRGLDRDTAQRLLKWAFLEDVVARIQVPELRRQIERSLAGQMNEAQALEELL